jgi:uncharacterized repeat protein (TIGR03803 family)
MGTMIQLRLAVACALPVIAIAPVQAQVQEKVLQDFEAATRSYPVGDLILAPDGIYGATNQGGTANAGVVYKWDTASNYTVLHNFTGGADGGYPQAGVIRDSAGIAERIVRARTYLMERESATRTLRIGCR